VITTILVTVIVLGVAAAILALLFLRGTHATRLEDRAADPPELALLDRETRVVAGVRRGTAATRVHGVSEKISRLDMRPRTAAKGWKGKP
jgi:hypothetical protein